MRLGLIFAGTMGRLMRAVEDGTEPELSGRDDPATMALVEAAYRPAAEERAVGLTGPEEVTG